MAKNLKNQTLTAAFVVVIGAALLAVFAWLVYQAYFTSELEPDLNDGQATVTIDNIVITVDLATSSDTQALGLSGRDSLEPNAGMLFVYETAQQPSFWMKDMKFAIDFIWIYQGRVVEIFENVLPSENNMDLAIYRPSQIIDLVLEVEAGFCASNSIEVGDEVVVE
ncbi:MAG: DUF192 domain-containing protein [bacterium]